MPQLHIVVCDAPTQFETDAVRDLWLVLQGKKGNVMGRREGADVFFEVDIEARENGAATGPFVQRQPDGRRFLYLQWWGLRDASPVTFRRIKLFFDQMPGWPDQGLIEVRVNGRDRKGAPACARAQVLTS